MADLTVQFEDLPLIHINGMTAATVDGAADIETRSSPRTWEVISIRLNGWLPGLRKGSFATLVPGDAWFFEVANAIAVDLALSALIERELAARPCRASAYDRARDRCEAA